MIEETGLEKIGAYLERLGLTDQGYFAAQKDNRQLTALYSRFYKRYGTDLMTYELTTWKNWKTNIFSLEAFNAKLTRVPLIRHGHFEGIDTQKLEGRLAATDWSKPFAEITARDLKAAGCFNELMLLSMLYNKTANRIADQLMLKYWAGTPIEKHVIICKDRSSYEQVFSFPLNKDFNDVDAAQAYNLLSGRAVLKFKGQGLNWDPSHWVMLRDGELMQFPFFGLEPLLNKLPLVTPLNDFTSQELVAALANGGQSEVNLHLHGKEVRVFIRADPEHGQLAVFDAKMQPIRLTELQVKAKRSNQRRGKGNSL